MKKRVTFIILPILIITAALIWFFVIKETKDPNTIRISGNIEATDAQLGFKIAGRLEQCLVYEGNTVKKGDVLARIEPQDQHLGVALAQANLDRAQSMLAELEAGSRSQEIQLSWAKVLQAKQTVMELTRGSRAQEISSAVSDLNTALAAEQSDRTQLVQAKKDLDRFSTLFRKKNISQRDFELIKTQYDIAKIAAIQAASRVNIARQALSLRKEGPRSEQIEKAKAALIATQAEYALVKAGPRQEKIDQAKAGVNETMERLNQAKLQLTYTELIAPMDGIVFTRSAEPGEYLNPSTPVITLGDLKHPWLRAFVSEQDLGRIKLKDTVKVFTDSFADKAYEGVITYISSQAEFTPKSVQTFEERVKLMYRIKIALSNPDGELKPGMPADAVVSIPIK